MNSQREPQLSLPLADDASDQSSPKHSEAMPSRGAGVPKGNRLQCEICPNITDGCFDVCQRSHRHNQTA